ncbi:MAG: PEP-CTERM sorting domain-containing protein [Candidatus Accumulibacter phosphatis]|uniref:PEP-CTERM sorting domain-containing protein n=1 Tax=Candidatus Thiothrix phosphatis TaxID=3112415 RepID=A0ABU6CXB7_9GAMM|nr:PEP-CTERM sorting domain-containing protein [Candidatus Thiothrix sp. Deng01]MCQ1549069.1 PEP-CTERM sorting domain-containing protein [Candidatus Accumulibacter phosphatis]MEB4590737.1 PEP-CTERM sorting domain-containing protein [Candidatus Thiothrix sp. Deng01]
MKNLKQLTPVALALGLAMASIGAQAVTIGTGLVPGLNDLIDESRETYVDVNSNGRFDAGDVIYGYIRLSDFQPSGLDPNNQAYGVFSQEIDAKSSGRDVYFKPTTVAGLTLNDLLSNDANVNASAIAAFYDRSTPFVDLINNNPPGPPASMDGYIDYIHDNGTLRIVAGFSDIDDFLYSEISSPATALGIGIGSSNAPFVSANSSFTIASNSGAFSISYNATGKTFNDLVQVFNPSGGLVLAEVAVSSGSTGGAAGDSVKPQPKNWLNAGGAFTQCLTTGGDTNCGFTDKNNFTVNVVPEPGSLFLFSLALLGLTSFARGRKNQS